MVIEFTSRVPGWDGVCSRGCGNIPTKRDKELVHGRQFLRSVDVEGNGSWVEHGRVAISAAGIAPMGLVARHARKIAQAFDHTRIVRWCQPSFFHISEKLFHGIVMGTFCASRNGVCGSEGLPHGMTMTSEQILCKSSVIELRRWGGEDVERSGGGRLGCGRVGLGSVDQRLGEI